MPCCRRIGWIAWKILRRGQADAGLLIAFVASVITILAHGLVEFTLQWTEVQMDLALLLGVLAGAAPRRGETEEYSPRVRLWSALAFFALTSVFWNNVIVSARMTDMQLDSLQYSDSRQDLIANIDSLLERAPNHPDVYEARALSGVVDREQAREDLLYALELNPYSARLRQSMSIFEEQGGDLAAAIDWQRQAVELHPLDGMHRFRLVEILWKAGKKEAAREELRNAEEMLLTAQEQTERRRLRELMELPPPENAENIERE